MPQSSLNSQRNWDTFLCKAIFMERISFPSPNHRAEIDISRPFQSVKEAVALFGERLLVGATSKVYQNPPPPPPPPPSVDCKTAIFKSDGPVNEAATAIFKSDDPVNEAYDLARSLERLEAELVEIRLGVEHLEARESAIELVVASLSLEFQQIMSKIQVNGEEEKRGDQDTTTGNGEIESEEPTGYKERQTLAALLNLREEAKDDNCGRQWGQKSYQILKKKPIVPLVCDLFHGKKGTGTCLSIC